MGGIPEHLSSLDDRFYLINHVQLARMNGDMDYTLVGPPGIFVIETKHHRGYVSCAVGFLGIQESQPEREPL